MSYIAPVALELDEETYEVTFPVDIVLNAKPYRFSSCDGDVNPIRTIILNQDKSINVNYLEVTDLTDLIVSGLVTAQIAAGETVTITITKPDLTQETLTAVTDALKAYSATKQIIIAGLYKFKAAIGADAGYEEAESSIFEYTVNLAARSITITVVPA